MLGHFPIRIDELFTRRFSATEAHPRRWRFLFSPSCPGSIHDNHHAAQTEDHSYRVIAIRLNSVDTPAP